METKYRIPKIEEFVKGFTFEEKSVYTWGEMDFLTGKVVSCKTEDVWIEKTINKDPDIDYLKAFLENGYIRTVDGN